jgi:hypothetical protein
MVEPSFVEMSDRILALLTDNAAALGVDPAAIVEGYQGDGGAPPFLYVYFMPGESAIEDHGGAYRTWADVEILCGVPSSDNAASGLREGMTLAGRVLTLAEFSDLMFKASGIAFEARTAETTMIRLSFQTPYDPYADLLE